MFFVKRKIPPAPERLDFCHLFEVVLFASVVD